MLIAHSQTYTITIFTVVLTEYGKPYGRQWLRHHPDMPRCLLRAFNMLFAMRLGFLHQIGRNRSNTIDSLHNFEELTMLCDVREVMVDLKCTWTYLPVDSPHIEADKIRPPRHRRIGATSLCLGHSLPPKSSPFGPKCQLPTPSPSLSHRAHWYATPDMTTPKRTISSIFAMTLDPA